MDYLCNYLGMKHFNSLTPCFRCKCLRDTIPWGDLRPNADWRNHLMSPTDWHFMDNHILFSTPQVGLNLWHVSIDVMHCLDLGVSQHIVGSVAYMLVFDAPWTGNTEARITTVWDAICRAYEILGTAPGKRLAHITFTMLFDTSKSWKPTAYP